MGHQRHPPPQPPVISTAALAKDMGTFVHNTNMSLNESVENQHQVRKLTISQPILGQNSGEKNGVENSAENVASLNLIDVKMATNSLGIIHSNKHSLKGQSLLANTLQRQRTDGTIQGGMGHKFGQLDQKNKSFSSQMMSISDHHKARVMQFMQPTNKFDSFPKVTSFSPEPCEADTGDLENPSIPHICLESQSRHLMKNHIRSRSINSFWPSHMTPCDEYSKQKTFQQRDQHQSFGRLRNQNRGSESIQDSFEYLRQVQYQREMPFQLLSNIRQQARPQNVELSKNQNPSLTNCPSINEPINFGHPLNNSCHKRSRSSVPNLQN